MRRSQRSRILPALGLAALLCGAASAARPTTRQLERANPAMPLPATPLGHDQRLSELPKPPEPEKVRLGRWLFFDTRLSADGTVSCASCHRSGAGFSEPRKVSVGMGGRKGTRKAPSFINVAFAFFPEQFWDGRAPNLQEQAKGPMQNPVELGGTHDLVVRAVAGIAGYAPFFRKAFGDSRVTLDRIAGAISDYERTRVSGNSPWDRWRRLGDRKALTPEAMRGDALFFGKARCSRCHIATVLSDARFDSIRSQRPRDQLMLVGNSFTDWRFHNTGIGWDAKAKRLADPGRAGVTGRPADAGAFKTPGLRDTALHPPYMHDGSLPTLEAVIEHYRRGGVENPSLDPLIEPLELSDADVKALVAMLRSLTGEGYQDAGPALFPR